MKPARKQMKAVFIEGSTMRHVLVMTATGAAGLIAIFVVDLMSLLYISWLGDPNLTAGVGLASQVSFLFISVLIGLSIAVTALVSRAIGMGDREQAERYAGSAIVHIVVIATALAAVAIPLLPYILPLVGAKGETYDAAWLFLVITLPSNAMLAVGFTLSGVLRAAGDAKRSMWVTLAGAAVAAIFDPLLILGLRLDVAGAAIAAVLSRTALAVVGVWGACYVHGLVGRPKTYWVLRDLRPLMVIAIPAIITNLASPVANIYALRVFAGFGDAVIAGVAIIDRIVPVAFGTLFAMSGAVGPVIGQNFGAARFDRVNRTLTDCFTVAIVYGAIMWGVLALSANWIVLLFNATGATASLVHYFCTYGAAAWMFLGCLFAANASFNNLGFPLLATLFNWGRATIGVIPFVTVGAMYWGPEGGLLGIVAGSAIFGLASMATAYWVTARLARRHAERAVVAAGE